MHLAHPLEPLVTADRAGVLTVLHRAGQPLSGRTIAALTGRVSQPTVSRMLRDLVQTGLVVRVAGGYVINREHLAYPALDLLLDPVGELARRVRETVASWATSPVSVALFGSASRGEAHSASDLDVLVVRPGHVGLEDDVWAEDVAALGEHVLAWTGTPCEILEYDPDELQRLASVGDPLIASLLHDAVTLAGTNLPLVLGPVTV